MQVVFAFAFAFADDSRFSWCCGSWSFHEATEFMAHEIPMVIPLILKD